MANLFRKQIKVTDPKTGERVKALSRKWWGRYRAADGREKRVPMAADKAAARAMLNERVVKVEREKAGLTEPCDEQRKRPLSEHVADFERYLKNKDVTPKQIHTATTQLQCMINECKWKLIGDISASAALDFLGGVRTRGRSAQTYNHYLKSAKQFTRWLVRDRRATTDALAHLSKLNVSTDRRHDRRPLTPEEFGLLIAVAKTGPAIETLSGPDRAMMYVLAAWTGFRKGEIGSLVLRSLRLEDNPPTATVGACYSKRRRQDSQILHPEVVQRLKDWLATKTNLGPTDLLFPISGRVPGGKERKTHKMMQLDLKTARTKWIEAGSTPAERDRRDKADFLRYESEDGLFADFHSNRHMFITSLERAGLSPKMAQTLARHSDVRLTLGIYTHVGLHDQTVAIDSLPAPPAQDGKPATERSTLQATGTDGSATGDFGVPTVVPKGAENGAGRLAPQTIRIAPDCTEPGREDRVSGIQHVALNPDDARWFSTEQHQPARSCIAVKGDRRVVSPTGLEPVTFGFGDVYFTFAEKPQGP